MICSSELVKGTLETIVLKLLAGNNGMCGYEITRRVKEWIPDKMQITEGALYPALHAMESDGLVTTKIEYGRPQSSCTYQHHTDAHVAGMRWAGGGSVSEVE